MTEKDTEDLKKKHGEYKSNNFIKINKKQYQQLFPIVKMVIQRLRRLLWLTYMY